MVTIVSIFRQTQKTADHVVIPALQTNRASMASVLAPASDLNFVVAPFVQTFKRTHTTVDNVDLCVLHRKHVLTVSVAAPLGPNFAVANV